MIYSPECPTRIRGPKLLVGGLGEPLDVIAE